jgi:hypothetical protein
MYSGKIAVPPGRGGLRKLVHKFILLLEFDFPPTYSLRFKKAFRYFPAF